MEILWQGTGIRALPRIPLVQWLRLMRLDHLTSSLEHQSGTQDQEAGS